MFDLDEMSMIISIKIWSYCFLLIKNKLFYEIFDYLLFDICHKSKPFVSIV